MSTFDNISNNQSLKDRVYLAIKNAIIRGELLPEQHLVETDLSKAMNISRAPIREALNKLEQEGFIINLPRRGSKVAPITTKVIHEFYEMRKLMEPYAAKTSIQEIPEEDLLQLMEQLNALKNDTKNFDLYIAVDTELHSLLYRYLKNDYLRTTMKNLHDHSSRARYSESFKELKRESVLQTTEEHLAIIQAIMERNTKLVERAVYQHILNGERRTLAQIL